MSVASTARLKMALPAKPDFEPHPVLHLEVTTRDMLRRFRCWQFAFAAERKDHRYYELIEDTLHPEFDYRYFVICDDNGEACGVQPFFLLDQDLLAGLGVQLRVLIDGIRRVWPRFMRARVLMVGCAARRTSRRR